MLALNRAPATETPLNYEVSPVAFFGSNSEFPVRPSALPRLSLVGANRSEFNPAMNNPVAMPSLSPVHLLSNQNRRPESEFDGPIVKDQLFTYPFTGLRGYLVDDLRCGARG